MRNRSTYRKSEKQLINYNPTHVGRKKVGELWSTNKKVLGTHIDPPKSNFGAISDNYRLRLRISPEWIHLSKIGKVSDQLVPLPCWAKKVCELWSTNRRVIGAHVDASKWDFSREYISARRGCWPLKFLHALEIDQSLLAHPPGGLTLGSAPYF